MIRLFASFILALALLASPLAMTGGVAKAHAPMAGMSADCADMDHSRSDSGSADRDMSCAIACAAIPCSPMRLDERAVPVAEAAPFGLSQLLPGIAPEAETPPPRTASEI